MAEPTSVLDFYELILRVAEIAGVAYHGSTGQSRAMIPINNSDLHKCKRVVNDAIKMFIALAPTTGWRWKRRIMEVTFAPMYTGTAESGTSTSLTDTTIAGTYDDDYFNTYTIKITAGTGEDETATVTDFTGSSGKFDFSGGLSGGSTPDSTSEYRICRSTSVIDADSARYLLDQDFGRATGKITYKASSNRGHIISWTGEGEIRANREVTVITGYPRKAAIRPYGTRRKELIVDPQPSSADTIIFPYSVGFDQLELEAGIATAGTSASLTCGALAGEYNNDYFNDWILTIVHGTGVRETATITDYTGSSGKFDFTALSGGSTPDTTSVFYVEPASNKHPAGFEFDNVIISACKAQTEMQFKDIMEGFEEKFLNVDLPKAWELDARSAPPTMGDIGGQQIQERIWSDVTTDHDV